MRPVILAPPLVVMAMLVTSSPVFASSQTVAAQYSRVLVDDGELHESNPASLGIPDTGVPEPDSLGNRRQAPAPEGSGPEPAEVLPEPAPPEQQESDPPDVATAPETAQPTPPESSTARPSRSAPLPATSEQIKPEAPSESEQVALALNIDARWPTHARNSEGVVAGRQIVAYYGNPNSRYMGILGENEIETMAAQLKARASEYDAINGDIGVAPAFHIIYATVYEDANVGILRQSRLMQYINYAAENDILVFLDHQLGKHSVASAIRSMLPYLQYEHVHLAIDPEWSTEIPGKEIGQVDASEINLAQQLMSEYIREHNLPGTKMLVVHQFNWRMITNRERVRADYEGVELIHHADGFGNPDDKRASWEFNVLAENIPLKGFKLFYPKSWRRGGYDVPLMSPAEVMSLDPVPVYIQYQ